MLNIFRSLVSVGVSSSSPIRAICMTRPAQDLREFIDWNHHEGGESETHGRAWREEELRLKGWQDLHKIWHLCVKERNLLLTELAWRKVPKDTGEQTMLGMPRGDPKEEDPHRIRYGQILSSMKRVKAVMRERTRRELNPIKRRQMYEVIMAK